MLLYNRVNKIEKSEYILNEKWNTLYFTTIYLNAVNTNLKRYENTERTFNHSSSQFHF